MVRQHPASSALAVQRAEGGLSDLRSRLPDDVAEAAVTRGVELELAPTFAVVGEKLGENLPVKSPIGLSTQAACRVEYSSMESAGQ